MNIVRQILLIFFALFVGVAFAAISLTAVTVAVGICLLVALAMGTCFIARFVWSLRPRTRVRNQEFVG